MKLLLSVYSVLSMLQASIEPEVLATPAPSPVIVSEDSLEPEVKGIQTKVSDGYQQQILNQINQFRQSNGLSNVQMHPEVCAFASIRANQIKDDFSHQPFFDRIDTNSFPYSSYSLVTENLAETNDVNKVVQLWIDSGTHNENMRKDTPYVCVVRVGNFYAYAGWKP